MCPKTNWADEHRTAKDRPIDPWEDHSECWGLAEVSRKMELIPIQGLLSVVCVVVEVTICKRDKHL